MYQNEGAKKIESIGVPGGIIYLANTGESVGGDDIPIFSATAGKLERTIADVIETPVAVSSIP